MKKVGIVTFHRAENFGAVMQAYALQETLKVLGTDAYILDYKNSNIEAQYHIFNPSILWSRKNILASLRSYLKRFKSLKSRRIKKKYYVSFRNKFLNIAPLSLWRKSDILITGSDQVWNLHLTGGFDDFYFLNLPLSKNQKRISYAASSDKDPQDLLSQNSDKVKKALEKFDSISVREEFLKKQLLRYFDKNIDVNLDPTLLLEASRYEEIAIKPKENGYICVYHMTPTDEGRKLAERIASDRGLKVVELFGGYEVKVSNNICKADISPRELLGYLRYADEIVTTSFHGIAFSIKFGKNFWVIDKGDNFRQKNILSKLELSNRIVTNSIEANIAEFIDYKEVDKKLSNLLETSLDYLSKALI